MQDDVRQQRDRFARTTERLQSALDKERRFSKETQTDGLSYVHEISVLIYGPLNASSPRG